MDESAINEFFNVILHAPATAVREYVAQPNINVEIQNEKGDCALLLAARRGDIDVVQALLDPPVCANIHSRNLKGSNALIAAAMKGHTAICALLLACGADVNQTTESQDTALSLAIWQNHTAVCLLLMDAGANVDNVDKYGDTMLLDAAKHGNVSVMQMLLHKQSLPINHCNKKGDSALIRSAWKGELDAMNLLLDSGADPTIVNKTGCTALVMAALHNNRACVKALIERETSPINAADESGRSAFAYLALYAPAAPMIPLPNAAPDEPDWNNMMLLLERHCRIDTPENMGNLLMCRAANINHIPLMELLLQEGADINFCDPSNKDRPPLLAHLQGAPLIDCTRFLLEHGAKIDYQDADGHSAIHFAIKHNSPDMTSLLLQHGASTLVENTAGETASDMCLAMIHTFQQHVAQVQAIIQSTQITNQLAAAAGVNGSPNSASPIGENGSPNSSNSNNSANGLSVVSPAIEPPSLLPHQQSLEKAQKCLQLLTEKSAREMGTGALLLQAAQQGDLEKLEAYLTVGVREEDGSMQAIDVNFTDKTGRSALMSASKSNHTACVRYLLHQGALLNLRDKDGATALLLAIRSNAKECAELLAETIQGHTLSRHGHHQLFQTQMNNNNNNNQFNAFPGQNLQGMNNTSDGSRNGNNLCNNRDLTNGTGIGPRAQSLNSLSNAVNGMGFNGGLTNNNPSMRDLPAANAQIFGLKSTPQQMAQEEFEQSTLFLRNVAQQLRTYLVQGKQAVYDSFQQKSNATTGGGANNSSANIGSSGSVNATVGGSNPISTSSTGTSNTAISVSTSEFQIDTHALTSAASPLHLTTPMSTLPRSSSYFNSFPTGSPTSAATTSTVAQDGLQSQNQNQASSQ